MGGKGEGSGGKGGGNWEWGTPLSTPSHRDIEGNELADRQAKEAANEMVRAEKISQ